MADRCDVVEPLLSAWVDVELRPRERSRVAAHLQRCPRCRAVVAELRVTSAMLRSMPVRSVPADVVARPATLFGVPVRQLQTPPVPRSVVVRRALTRSAAGVAAALTLVGATAFALGAPPEPMGPRVAVPVDTFVGDHLVRSVGGPVSTPALLPAP